MTRRKTCSESPQDRKRLAVREVRTVYTGHVEGTTLVGTPLAVARVVETLFDTPADPRENLFALYLDSRNRLIGAERVARGSMNACGVSPREVFSSALVAGAASVVVVHNHPSGDVTPSVDDLQFTTRLAAAGRLLGVELVDHVIVAGLGAPLRYVSLAERGVL
jgi:DNA repair protein RadC